MENVTIKTTGWEMTDEISAYLDEKMMAISKMLLDPNDSTMRCEVELSHVRDSHAQASRAEMNLFTGGTTYRAEATGETMQAALDALKDEMQHQLRKTKSKNMSLLRRGGAQIKNWLKFGRQ